MDQELSTSDEKMTYEELAKYAQSFLSNRPVVVLGTGATIPHGLPNAVEALRMQSTKD